MGNKRNIHRYWEGAAIACFQSRKNNYEPLNSSQRKEGLLQLWTSLQRDWEHWTGRRIKLTKNTINLFTHSINLRGPGQSAAQINPEQILDPKCLRKPDQHFPGLRTRLQLGPILAKVWHTETNSTWLKKCDSDEARVLLKWKEDKSFTDIKRFTSLGPHLLEIRETEIKSTYNQIKKVRLG